METKQVILCRADLKMSGGKLAAQVAHASMGVFTKSADFTQCPFTSKWFLHCPIADESKVWLESSFTKVCLKVNSEEELLSFRDKVAGKLPYCLIQDNGRTIFNNIPTYTCLAIGPAESGKIDEITRELKLY